MTQPRDEHDRRPRRLRELLPAVVAELAAIQARRRRPATTDQPTREETR